MIVVMKEKSWSADLSDGGSVKVGETRKSDYYLMFRGRHAVVETSTLFH